MKEVKSIELVLENCEMIEIKREHIGSFNLSNIRRSISRIAANSICDSLSAEDAFIQISSKANTINSYSFTWDDNKILPFDRLTQHKDITAIEIHYEDGSNEYIYVNWGGKSDYTNLYQTSKINQHTGDLYIAISEKYKVDDYFAEEIEKENSYVWDLYS